MGALWLLEEAERLGVPKRVAEDLADRVMLFELTPEEALAVLRRLASRRSEGVDNKQ